RLQDQTSGLRDDVGDRGINRGQDAADLVPDRVQAHGRRLLGAFEDQGTPIGLQDNQEVGEVIIRVPARWGSCPHVQGRAGLDGDQHEILAEDNVATTEPRPEPARLQLWWHVESQACRVRHSNVEDLKTSVEKKWKAMKRSYIITVCQAFRRRVEAVMRPKVAKFTND
ncbi:Putative transposable element, partial [Caligus rogercresseyi]